MALVPFEAPDTAAHETPTKSKQKSLFEFWSTEKETKPSSEGCELQAGSHVKLRKGLSGMAIVAFERSFEASPRQRDPCRVRSRAEENRARIRVVSS